VTYEISGEVFREILWVAAGDRNPTIDGLILAIGGRNPATGDRNAAIVDWNPAKSPLVSFSLFM